jgi:hypothetical protein
MGYEIVDDKQDEELWNPWSFPSFFTAMENNPQLKSPPMAWLLVIGLYNTMQEDLDHTANDFDGMSR